MYIRGELAWEYENPFATEDMDPGLKELSGDRPFLGRGGNCVRSSGRVRTRDLYWLSPRTKEGKQALLACIPRTEHALPCIVLHG